MMVDSVLLMRFCLYCFERTEKSTGQSSRIKTLAASTCLLLTGNQKPKMGPKAKGKKHKKGKKEKEKRPKTPKSEYLARIAEQNALLAAARRRVQEVENIYFSTEKKHEQTVDDMEDIIKYLQHEIQENETEIATYDEKIAASKDELNANDKQNHGILAKMKALYDETEKGLNYKIRQHIPKLSAYEEIRQQREEYIRKKKALCKRTEDMRTQHEKEIYEAEKQVIIKQDTMQKEMELRLTNLATDFNQATDIAIGETTNKLIKDNILLGNMLTCTQEIFNKTRESYQKVREKEKLIRYSSELLDEEHLMFLQKYTAQVNSIENLVKTQEELQERIGLSGKLTRENRRLEREIAEKECILKTEEDEYEELQRKLYQSEEKFNSIKSTITKLRKTLFNLEYCFYEASRKVKQAIEIENLAQVPEEYAEEAGGDAEKDEQEENLNEFKYKVRQSMTMETVDLLSNAMSVDSELTLIPSDINLNLNLDQRSE